MARQVLPSVVYIEMEGAGGKAACYGSGFFVAPAEILTNKHVVTCSGTGRGRVKLAGGQRSYPTRRILASPDLDLSLIEIQGLTAPPLRLDTTRRLSVGDDIFVAGNPEGLEGTFTRGIVSGVSSEGGLLQIDASVSPGSSGGPVVDSYCSVVGVTVSSIREGQNLNFAIPAPLLSSPLGRMRQMLARLRKGGAPAAGARPPATSTTPESVNTAPVSPPRRTWEAQQDWGISSRSGSATRPSGKSSRRCSTPASVLTPETAAGAPRCTWRPHRVRRSSPATCLRAARTSTPGTLSAARR